MDLGQLLIDELGITPPAVVALVGGGGKTTLMRAMHAEAARRGWAVVAGTTTKVYARQAADLPGFLHGSIADDKLTGATDAAVRAAAATHDLVVIEADGSRSKVVKAPARHEPVVPSCATHVVAVIGADALDRVIEDVAHRPMLVGAVCGCSPYGRLTVERAARLLVDPERGGAKAVPEGARFAVAITRIGPAQQRLADELTALLAGHGVSAIQLPFR